MDNKYMKIVNAIKNMIEGGDLKSGSRAPSILNICENFKCSKSTAIRAYDELQKEHVLFSVPKSGFYVVERKLKKQHSDENIIDFSSASPNIELLPYEDFQHSINQAINTYNYSLFNYSDIEGNIELRKTLKNHFRDFSIFTKLENIIISSGSQQAIYILSMIPFPNNKSKVLIEQPTYYGAIKALESNNISAIGIDRDINGIDMNKLEEILRTEDIKFFYIIPRFHNPTGFSLSNNQKKQIIALAKKYDVYIVEDDYLADLEMNSKAETMYSMDPSGKVIYLKSFSKTLLPGLRVAALLMPDLLVNTFLKHKVCCDFITNPLSQGALEIYLKSKMYDKHVHYIKRFYIHQMKILKEAINKEFLELSSVSVPKTGFFASISIPNLSNNVDLEKILCSRKVQVVNINKMFLDEHKKNNALRLSVCNVNEKQIFNGIRLISEEVNRCIR